MSHRATTPQRAAPFAASVLIGASIATPAFAAMPNLPQQWQPYLLIGSVILLAVALMLKVLGAGRPRVSDAGAKPIDMRDSYRAETIDIPMHQ
ncbi:MAG: hypothetical protein ACHP7M_03880 [Burkholderiales bacterium]|jgi:hypothetical protein